MDRRKSYLCARDTSISQIEIEESENNCIEVFLRLKKNDGNMDLYQVDGNNYVHKDHTKNNRQYTFSKIFNSECNQVELFNKTVKPKFLHFMNGNNYSLLAYGISGSGKTFTIIGDHNSPGIVPRFLEYLFRTVPFISQKPEWFPEVNGQCRSLSRMDAAQHIKFREEAMSHIKDIIHHKESYNILRQHIQSQTAATVDDEKVKCDLWVTFMEIYNESVFDLLNNETNRPKLKIHNVGGNAYVKGLTTIHISSDIEAYLLLQLGLQKIKYASTGMNNHSSRSHCIFSIKLIQYLQNSPPIISVFNLYDLAGSEKQKMSNNVGDRLAESNSINKSLLTLNKCIKMAMAQQNKSQTYLPLRESKLTQLLQAGLSGKEPLTMIVALNPLKESLSDTENVLNFSAIAQKVLVKHGMENLRARIISSCNSDLDESEILEEIDHLNEIIEKPDLSFEERSHINEGILSTFLNLSKVREFEFMRDNNKEELNCKLENLIKMSEDLMNKDEELVVEIEELLEEVKSLDIDVEFINYEEQEVMVILSDTDDIISLSDEEEGVSTNQSNSVNEYTDSMEEQGESLRNLSTSENNVPD